MADQKNTNDNVSFSALLKNPDRDYAYGLISQCVGGLEMHGISRDIIVRGLFTMAMAKLGQQEYEDVGKDQVDRYCLLTEMYDRTAEVLQKMEDIVLGPKETRPKL